MWIWHRFLYRPVMRFAHRFNWHYMEPMPIIEKDWQQIWCQWCGARYSRYIGPPTIGSARNTGAE